MNEIEVLQALINDEGLDAFELSQLGWLHTKATTFTRYGQNLEEAEARKYKALTKRFLALGVCKDLPALASPSLGLGPGDLAEKQILEAKVVSKSATLEEQTIYKKMIDRQIEHGLKELDTKKVVFFQDPKGNRCPGFDETGLITLAELQFKQLYGSAALLDAEKEELIKKSNTLIQIFDLGYATRDIQKREWNRMIVELSYDLKNSMAGSDPTSRTAGLTPSLARLLHPTFTVDETTVPQYPELSETLLAIPPYPIDKRPLEEQNFIQTFATLSGIDVESILKNFTALSMRAAQTVISDRETRNKILIMETDYIRSPTLGKTSFFSKAHEDYIKARFNRHYFADNIHQSHPLKYLLNLHTKLSESWQLDNECSIDLLERLLKGDAFKRIHTYLKIERSISRCYQVLQSIYSDELNPAEAQLALDKYIKNPSAHDPPHNTIEEVFLHIHMLCSRIHSLEMDPSKRQNTLSSVFSAVRWYLGANFVPREVKQLYLTFDEHMNEHKDMANTSYAFFTLKGLTKRKFVETLPRHALVKSFHQTVPVVNSFKKKPITYSMKPMGKLEEIKPNPRVEDITNSEELEEIKDFSASSVANVAGPSEMEGAKYISSEEEEDEPTAWARAYVEANEEECMAVGDPEPENQEEQIPEDEIQEMTPQMDYSKMSFPEHIRCRLCSCSQKEAHSPPFFRSCTFFRGQIPQKIQQRCCGGFHSNLTQGTMCPVVKALGKREFRPVYNKPFFRPRGAGGARPAYNQQRGGFNSTPRMAQNTRPQYQQKPPNRQVF